MPGECPKCKKTVYFAEERIVLRKPYHKMCIKCANCNKLLDSSSFTEHKDEMYCKSCYGKLFGPNGYGLGVGLSYENGPQKSKIPATLEAYIAPLKHSDQEGKAKWGGANYCPRCSNAVFMAEQVMAAGAAWHKACFTCKICNKGLDSHTLRERGHDVYCHLCYGKNYGPKGYWGWASAKVS